LKPAATRRAPTPRKRPASPTRPAARYALTDAEVRKLGREVGKSEARADFTPEAGQGITTAVREFRKSLRGLPRKEIARLNTLFSQARIRAVTGASGQFCLIKPARAKACSRTIRIEIRESGIGLYGDMPVELKRRALSAAMAGSGGHGKRCMHSVQVSTCLKPKRHRDSVIGRMAEKAAGVLERAGFDVRLEKES
jgi:hypothetical protein